MPVTSPRAVARSPPQAGPSSPVLLPEGPTFSPCFDAPLSSIGTLIVEPGTGFLDSALDSAHICPSAGVGGAQSAPAVTRLL